MMFNSFVKWARWLLSYLINLFSTY